MNIKVDLQNVIDHGDPDQVFLICRHGSGHARSQ